MAASDAKPIPQRGVAYRHYFAIRDNTGALVTTWAGQDSEVSLDGAAFGDCTNEATEIGTSGCGYIDLTAAEMDADCVLLKVTVTNTDALPYVISLFPEELGDIRTDAVRAYSGTGVAIGTVTSQTQFTLTSGPTKDISDGLAIFADADDGGEVSVAEIDSYTGGTGVLVLKAAPGFTVTTSDTVSLVSVPSSNVQVDAASVRTAVGLAAANLDTQLAAIVTDTGTDIPATLATIAGYIDTEVAAIKAVTDNLPDGGALSSISSAILDAAGVRAAVGLAAANLDTQLAAKIGIGTSYRFTNDASGAGYDDVTVTEAP